MTPQQCRQARALLGWSRGELADAAELPLAIVAMFEADDLVGMARCEFAMREALEAAGVAFTIGRDRRMTPRVPTWAPPAAPMRFALRATNRRSMFSAARALFANAAAHRPALAP